MQNRTTPVSLCAAGGMYQIDTEGDALVCAAIAPTGECLAFGGSGGYVHLWATSAEPSINQMRQVGMGSSNASAGQQQRRRRRRRQQ